MPDYWLRAPGYFNSRPSARGDLMARSKTKKISHFNSRPSARGDVRAASRGRGLCISIHAPPRGATGVSTSRSSVSLRISIHAPPRGATARQNVGDCIRVFQFTPLREGRLLRVLLDEEAPGRFQFTPLREGRQIKPGLVPEKWRFQFTPLREGRPRLLQNSLA